MASATRGGADKLEVSPNLWAGVGLVRGGAGTALVGDPATVAERMKECIALGIDTFILSGYPHLEEAYRFAELVFPLLPLASQRGTAPTAGQHRVVRRDDRERAAAGRPPGSTIMSAVRAPGGATGLTQWALPVGILVIWEALSLAGWIPDRVLPAPTAVAAAGWRLLLSGELARNVWVSTWRAFAGLAVGGGIGFAFGLANGLSDRSEQVFDSTLQMVRNIPHLALIPLVILWFGIDEGAKLPSRGARCLLSDLHQYPARHPHGRSAARRDGPHLRHVGGELVLARDPARRAAVDFRRAALRARHHVAHPHRRRNHRGVLGDRLHGDAGTPGS